MKRRRILLLLALAAVAALLVLCWPRGPKEPLFEGRPLSVWIPDPTTFNEPRVRVMAEKAIRSNATNALPWLMTEYTRYRSGWLDTVNGWLAKIKRTPQRMNERQLRYWRAGEALKLLGPAVTPALPELALHLGDPDRSVAMALVMAGAGEAALPYFTNHLASTNTHGHVGVVQGLGQLAKGSETAIPPLVSTLQSTNFFVRLFAISNLRGIALRPDLVVPALTNALSDPDGRVRANAAATLGSLSNSAHSAIPALRSLLTDTNARVATSASNALFRIDPAALPARGP